MNFSLFFFSSIWYLTSDKYKWCRFIQMPPHHFSHCNKMRADDTINVLCSTSRKHHMALNILEWVRARWVRRVVFVCNEQLLMVHYYLFDWLFLLVYSAIDSCSEAIRSFTINFWLDASTCAHARAHTLAFTFAALSHTQSAQKEINHFGLVVCVCLYFFHLTPLATITLLVSPITVYSSFTPTLLLSVKKNQSIEKKNPYGHESTIELEHRVVVSMTNHLKNWRKKNHSTFDKSLNCTQSGM